MNTNEIRPIVDWMKATDVIEVVYKRGGRGFSLVAAGLDASPGGILASRYVPVTAESVGVFQWAEPGQARYAEEGSDVAAGASLGVIVNGSGKARPITAPCAGRVAKCLAEAGQAVEYGRPLFLIEPRA